MKRFFYIFLFFTFHFSLFTQSAHADEWKIYASYHNATKAVKAGERIFVLANGNLFSYDKEDTSVETYDKTNALSDLGIMDIAYCSAIKMLTILYNNGNIDLMAMDGTVYNLSELKTKSLTDKTINELRIQGTEALISLNSGLVVVDLKKRYFSNFYQFDSKVTNAVVSSNKIYVKTAANVYEGDRTMNLLNKNNWKVVDASTIVFGLTNEEKAEIQASLEAVKDIVPNSPIRNYSYHLNMIGDRLLVAGGNWYYPEVEYAGTAMKYEGGKWTSFDEEEAIKIRGESAYHNVIDIVQDPDDSEHHFIGTKRSGVYEFKDYKLVNHYCSDNSPIKSILPNAWDYYCYERVTGLQFDPDGNLWMMNNRCDSVVRILTKDKKWISYYYAELDGCSLFQQTAFDQRGWAWLVERQRNVPNFYSMLFVIDTKGTINTQADDRTKRIYTFLNQDNTSYTPNNYYCIKEDLEGAMWIGTSDGLFVAYNPETVFDDNFSISQVKVPRNDGSGYADYLLNGVSINSIAVDGGNRKWIGTTSDGVYLISSDGLETIHHFKANNSSLISDNINDIAINGSTGEVFIATDAGLCSFKGDATDPAEELDSKTLKVYPNPVRPEYAGDVHVTGLAINSEVKIADAGGRLVYQGISNGGRFDWNCCYKTGKKVSSGIYYILCTDEEGKKGACAKLLIVR